MRLHLVRHLKPTVDAGLCYGRTDLQVAPALLAQALPALKAQLPQAPLISSPLARCASLSIALSNNISFDARLVELDFGAWELRRWDDISRSEVDAWAADLAHYRPGGGESVCDMAHRVARFYDGLRRTAAPDVIIVCHAGSMRLLEARHAGLAPEAMARHAAQRANAIGYGEVRVLSGV